MATLNRFFEALGEQRCALITHVSADAADWIARCVGVHVPTAVLCADPFHIVAWASEGIDEVRRNLWNEARGGRPAKALTRRRNDRPKSAVELRRVRWALWKNPEDLTERQQHQLDWIAENHPSLWRAYRLKEGLRYVFAVKGQEGKEALDAWLSWACRSQLKPFIYLARRIRRIRPSIDATLEHGLSNGLIESMTPRSASSPASPSASAPPTHSSPWPCSPSAASGRPYPAENDPQISQEIPITSVRGHAE